ncbi:MAG: DUF2339 domain-containing protein [Sulfurovum sp.]|nr:DUF2339 domain-containing protein [Sulfurovum sp.]
MRVGSVILFIGLAFLVKYASEHSVISMEIRLWFVAVVAVVLIVLGWRLREREGAYGQILQGLGIAILYLLIYATSKFYDLLSLDTAFILMFFIVILGSVLAVIENALALAFFATAGGFLVPLLTSTGEGSSVLLFSYYTLLNLGVFSVAWYRSWRVLNLLGFVFTFVITSMWGILHYTPELFTSTEPFLILYFFMYLAITILFTLKHPFEPKNLVDGTLVFGLPVIAFPLQIKLVHLFEYGEAYSAVFLGLVYLLLYRLLKDKERSVLLAQSFLALSVVFGTISIPYIFDADVTAVLWSLESAGMIWLSLKQSRKVTRYAGEFLLFLSLCIYYESLSIQGATFGDYLGYIIVIIASLLGSYLLDTHPKKLPFFDRFLAKVFLFFAMILWFKGADTFSYAYFAYPHYQELLIALLVGASLLMLLTHFIAWQLLVSTLQGTLVLGIWIYMVQSNSLVGILHPFEGVGIFALGGLFILHFIMLYRYAKLWYFKKEIHLIGLWFIVILFTLELQYHINILYHSQMLNMIALVMIPLLTSMALLRVHSYKSFFAPLQNSYQLMGVGIMVLWLFLWEYLALFLLPSPIDSYLPLLNTLDMIQILVMSLIFYWIVKNNQAFTSQTRSILYVLSSIMSILILSTLFARSVHIYQGGNIPYHPSME